VQPFDAALALHRAGRLEEAGDAYRALLAAQPSHAGALHLLGVVEGQCGRFAQAAEAIERSLLLEGGVAAAHANLGNARHALGQFEASLASCREALRLEPSNRSALLGQGKACWSLGHLFEALDSYDAALRVDAECAEAWMNRGDILLTLGRRGAGVDSLRRAIACGADPQRIHYVLASIGIEPVPGAAPPGYVKDLFDSYADRFDKALVEALDYRTPQLLAALLPQEPAMASRDVLDLGCGTGLCGPLLRPIARRLVGVDLSDNMLARARERGLYDRLECAEITAWLGSCGEDFDVVVAADVFVYFGDLAPVFAALRRIVRGDGRFVFSVEATDASEPELAPTRRYRHSRSYLRRLAEVHGFAVETMQPGVLRRNEGAGVDGTLVSCRPAP
jgi:predicted TPR repeat methyltransferase